MRSSIYDAIILKTAERSSALGKGSSRFIEIGGSMLFRAILSSDREYGLDTQLPNAFLEADTKYETGDVSITILDKIIVHPVLRGSDYFKVLRQISPYVLHTLA